MLAQGDNFGIAPNTEPQASIPKTRLEYLRVIQDEELRTLRILDLIQGESRFRIRVRGFGGHKP